MKTKDLIGPALEYAVALAEGYKFGKPSKDPHGWVFPVDVPGQTTIGQALLAGGVWLYSVPHYSTGPAGDEIIDREGISVIRCDDDYVTDAQGFTTNERIAVWAATTGQHSTCQSHEHEHFDAMYWIDESDVVYGPTRRIAAMRAHVALKRARSPWSVDYSVEIEIPEELK